MRRPPGSTYCFDIWRAAIDHSNNARQPLFIPNSSFLIPHYLRQIPIRSLNGHFPSSSRPAKLTPRVWTARISCVIMENNDKCRHLYRIDDSGGIRPWHSGKSG